MTCIHKKLPSILLMTIFILVLYLHLTLTQEITRLNSDLSELTRITGGLQSENLKLHGKCTELEKVNKELTYKIAKAKVTKQSSKKPSRGGYNARSLLYSNKYEIEATAYGATTLNGGAGTGHTCTGVTPEQGRTIAVDSDVIPLGTTVYLECKTYPEVNGTYIAEDVGGGINGNRIDIYFNDLTRDKYAARKDMIKFGRRDIIVYILK